MSGKQKRVELDQCIVADPKISHGKPTFKGARIFDADVLADVEQRVHPSTVGRRKTEQ